MNASKHLDPSRRFLGHIAQPDNSALPNASPTEISFQSRSWPTYFILGRYRNHTKRGCQPTRGEMPIALRHTSNPGRNVGMISVSLDRSACFAPSAFVVNRLYTMDVTPSTAVSVALEATVTSLRRTATTSPYEGLFCTVFPRVCHREVDGWISPLPDGAPYQLMLENSHKVPRIRDN